MFSFLIDNLIVFLKILDTNPQLFFHLQQQRMIELIRNGKVEAALEFAQEELAPRGEENVIIQLTRQLHSTLLSSLHINHTFPTLMLLSEERCLNLNFIVSLVLL